MQYDYSVGRVVYSKAGRDAGKRFIILGAVDASYVLISDGDLRRVEKPKKKKIKHLDPTEIVIEPIADKLSKGIRVPNAEIRKALTALGEKDEGAEKDSDLSNS